MRLRFQHGLGELAARDLEGFDMLGVPTGRLHAMLSGSEKVVLAFDGDRVVGYGAAIGDGVLFAFLTALEVRADYRRRGIGSRLVRELQAALGERYAFDLACDEELVPFYEVLGFTPARAMLSRNFGAR